MTTNNQQDTRRFYAETIAEQETAGQVFHKEPSKPQQYEILARYGVSGAKADALLAELASISMN
ncbi:hypothetical protein [Pandoraea sputorum]|uniref:hypothetical protein n=1 Tax=Pandoraea sputorum TaxID=93222 RepID=UPI00123FA4B1|nr:hypothetical protein [Pandoraea sputorum]